MLTFFDDSRNILKSVSETGFLISPGNDNNRIEFKKELSKEEDYIFYYKIDLCSNENKFFINLHTSYYHSIVDTLSHILVHNKKYPSTNFIINCYENSTKEALNSFYDFFFEALVDEGIKYEKIHMDDRTALKINNVSYIQSTAMFSEGLTAVSELIEKYRPQKSVEPYRKVFLSRSKTRKRDYKRMLGDRDPENFNFLTDERMDSEEFISNYFSSIGFEVVSPEDFSSFEDQIEYFNSVKMLVSPTSAGLTNGLLMQKNQTVVELEVPIVASGRETLHSLYAGVLFLKGHLFIMIPSMRNSIEVINKIGSNKNIMEILND